MLTKNTWNCGFQMFSRKSHNKALQLTQRSTLVYVHSLRSLLHNTHYNRCAIELSVSFKSGILFQNSQRASDGL